MSVPGQAPTALRGATRQPGLTLGPRALATTARIVDAARELFLEQGFAGTTIEQIAERAGVSKASFYTYFPTKRDAFVSIGRDAYRSIMEVIDAFEALEAPIGRGAIEAWVARYWAFMEDFGAFILVAPTAGPSDEELRRAGRATQLRAARKLGRSLRACQRHPSGDDAALGLSVLAMLERACFFARVAALELDEAALLSAQSDLIEQLLLR